MWRYIRRSREARATTMGINQRDHSVGAVVRRAVTAMPLLNRGMRRKAKRFAGRLRYRARSSSVYARGLPRVKFNINGE